MKKYIIILILFSILLAFLLPFNILLNFAHDDSFFYLKTADNIAKGFGSTFDKVNITNGYHPLYLIILSIIFLISNILFNTSPEILYRIMTFIHFIIIFLIIIYVLKSFMNIYKKDNNKQLFIFIILLIGILVGIRDFGVESHLLCLIIAFYIYIKSIEINSGKIFYYIKPVLLSLLFLARTDYLLLVIPFLIFADVLLSEKSQRKKILLNYLLFLFISSVLYYSVNYLFFKRFETVSGLITNGFPVFHFIENIKYLLSEDANIFNQFSRLIFCIFSICIFCIVYFMNKDKNNTRFDLILISAGIGSLIFILIHLCFNNYSLREWYLTYPSMISAIMLAIVINRYKKLQLLMNISLIFILIIAVYFSKIESNKFRTGYEYSKKIKLVLNENERIFQMDMCGLIGFFSERNIINGDGLINSFEYLEVLNKGKLSQYLKEKSINYYSTYISKNINEKDSVFTDTDYSNRDYGFKFKFSTRNILLKEKYEWHHLLKNSNGNWYLFKIND